MSEGLKQRKLLFTPGPLNTSAAVREHMGCVDLGSRDTEFKKIQLIIRAQLLKIGGVEKTHECILLQGSGTYAVEAAVGASVPRGGTALVISNGAYGARIGTICDRLDIKKNMMLCPWDSTPSPAAVAAELAARPVDTVFIVHHETTAGITNDVEGIRKILANNETLVVDSMSGFGALPINLDNVDFMVSSANKCIPGVPGFAFVLAKKEALVASKGVSRSLVLDLYDQWSAMEKSGQFRFTPPTHVMLAFHKALEEHTAAGGCPATLARFHKNHAIIKGGLRALGFDTIISDDLQSPIITCFKYPTDDFDFDKFYDSLGAQGFVIYPGKMQGDLAGKTFRVGNIGDIHPPDCEAFVAAVAAYQQGGAPKKAEPVRVVSIGLGKMGTPLNGRIASNDKFSVSAYDVFPGGADRFQASFPTATAVNSVEELLAAVAKAQVITTCLPNTGNVKEAWETIKPALTADSGHIWLDATSGRSDEAAALAEALWSEHKIGYLDCAVSGGPKGARNGILAALVGGTDDTFQRAKPVISCFSDKITHLGPAGSGHLVKAMNNAMLGAQMLVASEGLAAVVRHGVDLNAALKAINGSSGRSWVTMQRFPDNVTTGKPYGFALGMHCKDMDNALRASRMPAADAADDQQAKRRKVEDAGEPIVSPMLELAQSLMHKGKEEFGATADHTETTQFAAKRHGVEFLVNAGDSE